MPDKSDKDTIIIDDVGTDKSETWITIKDASDLLGYSERHTWRIAHQNGWKTKKELNQLKRKTFVLRKDAERFYDKERERQRLEALNKPDNPDRSDKNAISDMSGKVMSDNFPAIDSQKTLPALLSEYKKSFTELQENQTKLLQKVTLWKTSLFWLIALTGIASGVFIYVLSDKTNTLSEQKLTINKQESLISQLNSNVVTLSGELSSMSGTVKNMSDKIAETQNNLNIAQRQIKNNAEWIETLEKAVPEEQIEQIPAKFIKRGE